jgi:hypothetical protein
VRASGSRRAGGHAPPAKPLPTAFPTTPLPPEPRRSSSNPLRREEIRSAQYGISPLSLDKPRSEEESRLEDEQSASGWVVGTFHTPSEETEASNAQQAAAPPKPGMCTRLLVYFFPPFFLISGARSVQVERVPCRTSPNVLQTWPLNVLTSHLHHRLVYYLLFLWRGEGSFHRRGELTQTAGKQVELMRSPRGGGQRGRGRSRSADRPHRWMTECDLPRPELRPSSPNRAWPRCGNGAVRAAAVRGGRTK